MIALVAYEFVYGHWQSPFPMLILVVTCSSLLKLYNFKETKVKQGGYYHWL